MTNAQHMTAVIAAGERWIRATMAENIGSALLASPEEAEGFARSETAAREKVVADFAAALDACIAERVRQALAHG